MKELQEEIEALQKEIAIDKKNEEIEAIEEEQEEINKLYEQLLSDKEIYGEADRLLTAGNVDEMLRLLESYSQDYSDVGHLLGQNFTEAFKAEIQNAVDALDLLTRNKNNFTTTTQTPSTSTPSPSVTAPATPSPSPSSGNITKGSRVKINNASDAIYRDSYTGKSSGSWAGAGVRTGETLYVVNTNNGRFALSRTNNISGVIGWIDKTKVSAFATGGYTGEFTGGKLGLLHQKERVLSAQQTEAFEQLVYDILPQLKQIPSNFFTALVDGLPKMTAMDGKTISSTVNNEWNIVNNTPVDAETMSKDIEKIFKQELRKFGSLKGK